MAELSKELKEIKKKYGETFMHICRDNFSTLLETEGLLSKVLNKYFATNSKSIGDDIINSGKLIEFKDFIFSKIDVEKEEKQIIEDRTPYEILAEAGYKLIECTTEDEIQEFRKYYAPDEVICTIYNGGRLKSSVVFFAVKDDAENIKREDFESPQREDEYGTSVLGIQFDKYGTCTPHIITRYNHTVNNPNGTYGNDLDRIAPGLTESFAKLLHERGLELNNTNIEKFEFPGYTVAGDGKYYKYNLEINGIYYCPGNVIIDHGCVKHLESEKEVLMDYFILDKEKKTLRLYDEYDEDSFLDAFENIEKIQMKKNPDKEKQTRIITIKIKDSNLPIKIEIDKDNNIVGYNNPELKQIGDEFLVYNEELRELNLPQLTEVGDYFLCNNCKLSELNLPQLTEVGNYFLCVNNQLSELNLPELTKVGDYFLCNNCQLSELYLPQLTEVGKYFLRGNNQLSELNLPELTKVGDDFLGKNEELRELNLPQLTEVGDCFLCDNNQLSELYLPELKEVGDNFLSSNEKIKELNLPQLEKEGYGFLKFHPRKKELIANMYEKSEEQDEKIYINPKEIAELDRDTELTITEVGLGKELIEKSMSNEKGNIQK